MMFVPFNSNTTGVKNRAGAASHSGPPGMRFPPVYSGIRGARSLISCVVFCRSLFILLFFFIWSLYCMSFDLQLLITPLVSSCT